MDQVMYRAKRHDKTNYFYMPYNGLFEYMLDDILDDGCFYNMENLMHVWGPNFFPDRFHQFDFTEVNHNVPCDMVMVNNRNHQANIVSKVTNYYHCPLVLVDHELPMPNASNPLRTLVNFSLPKSFVLCPHDLVKTEWVDYADLNGDILDVSYGFPDQKQYDKTNDTIFYNAEETESFEQLTDLLSFSGNFVCNIKPCSPPLEAMLAASFGCKVFVNRTRWTEEIFVDQETAFFYEKTEDVKVLVEKHKKNTRVGFDARRMIQAWFPLSKAEFLWKKALKIIKESVYIK